MRRNVRPAIVVLAAVLVCTGLPVPVDAANISTNPSSLTLCKGGGTGTFTATRPNNTIQASSANTSIATVSPASGTSPALFTVTAQATTGTTNVNLTDLPNGDSGTEVVNVNGPLSVTPTTMTISSSSSITVNDPGPNVAITANSSAPGVATVTANATTSAGSATLTVTPVSAGNATITVNDAAHCTAQTVTVTVTTGSLTVSKANITLNGAGANTTFTASEANYTGPITATSSNTNVVTVSPTSAPGPTPGPYTVTAAGTQFGPATVTVADNHGGSQPISVLVTGGTISASGGTSVSFSVHDNTNAVLPSTSSAISVTGSVQTTSTGSANITVSSPNNYQGSNGGAFNIGYLSYQCTNNNGGGSFQGSMLQLVAKGTATPCWSLGANAFANINFNLSLFLDDRAIPADSYNAHPGYSIVLTAS